MLVEKIQHFEDTFTQFYLDSRFQLQLKTLLKELETFDGTDQERWQVIQVLAGCKQLLLYKEAVDFISHSLQQLHSDLSFKSFLSTSILDYLAPGAHSNQQSKAYLDQVQLALKECLEEHEPQSVPFN